MELWHVIPEDDKSGYHKLNKDCWCKPKINVEDDSEHVFIMHNIDGESIEDIALKNYE